jgi:polysaccharide export outer membrane protein
MIRSILKKHLASGLALGLAWILLGVTGRAAPEENQKTDEHRKLAPGDTVQITVYQDPMLNTLQQVSTDGTVEMFYIGSVQVEGLTTQVAAARITDMLLKDKYIKNAQVRVLVEEYVKQVVTVGGQVNRPGPVTLSNEQPLDLWQAIGAAGGGTTSADLGNVEVRRIQAGVATTQKVNLKKLSKENRTFMVEPGDVINVGIRMF